ncbi:MAG: metallophosphoesterase family protein [Solirubrobacterales bacterium]
MRIAVLSDIHANLPAFEAVLAAIDDVGIEERWCLGDIVGYGAQPDACARLAEDRCEVVLAGNHDLAALHEIDITTFSSAAAAAAEWTRQNATAGTLDWLRSLEPAGVAREVGVFHASPRDPVWEYVLSAEQADQCLDVQEHRLALIGHSHVALWFHRLEDGGVDGQPAAGGMELDLDGREWLVNPGSVGQPRDGDPRAAWLELDLERERATWHRTPYDVAAAASAILEAGLPEMLARRLEAGQ